MNATAVEVEREVGRCEREFSIAKEDFERAEAAAQTAHGNDVLSAKRRVLEEKKAALEAAWARRGDPVPGQPAVVQKGMHVPSLMDRFMSSTPENRASEMLVRQLEHELDLLNGQIPLLERAFAEAEKTLGRFVYTEPTNDADGQRASENFSTALARDRQRANLISAELTPLRARLAKVQLDLETARKKRDEALNTFTAAEAKKK